MRRRHLIPTLPACALHADRRRPAHCLALSAKAIREKIAELTDRAQAIVDLAASEDRDLTDEEKTQLDAILGVGTKGDDDYKPGQIDQLERDLERAEKLEKRQAELAAARAQPSVPAQQASAPIDGAQQQPTIPACARAHGRMRAFRGPNAEWHAYAAGQFFAAVLWGNEKARQWCHDYGVPIVRGALSEGTDSAGGYLVPVELEQAIVDLREQYGVFRRFARTVPMASDTKNVPVRATGLTAYWVNENAAVTESDKTWNQVALTAKKLAALCRYSNELSEDAIISIADDLASEIAQAFAYAEDVAGFNGDGTATYGSITGVVNALAAGSIVTAASGNTGFETLDLTDFEACVGKLPEYTGIQPAWFISKAGYAASMMRLIDAAGGNTNATLAGGPDQREFLGYPVVVTQVLNSTLGADVDQPKAIFGDLRLGAVLGDRRGITIAISDQRYFEYDQLAIKGTERMQINVHSTGDASNAGALVLLKSAAA